MSEPFLAEIRMVGFNFAPRGWAFCDGQILPINQNQSLYSLIGTEYGGDGRTSFALPDLRGRSPLHVGTEGSNTYDLGDRAGVETVSVSRSSVETAHTHRLQTASGVTAQMRGTADVADSASPAESAFAADPVDPRLEDAGYSSDAPGASASAITLSGTTDEWFYGSSFPHDNMPPFCAVNFCIALRGVFPSR